MATWRAEGLNVVWYDVIVSSKSGQGPPDVEAARFWIQKHKFTHVGAVADPAYKLVPPGKTTIGTPSFVLVDPRSQTVTKWQEGAAVNGSHHGAIRQLALNNKMAEAQQQE